MIFLADTFIVQIYNFSAYVMSNSFENCICSVNLLYYPKENGYLLVKYTTYGERIEVRTGLKPTVNYNPLMPFLFLIHFQNNVKKPLRTFQKYIINCVS